MRANQARTNVGEVLRGNEGAKRPTDLAKTEPRSRLNGRRSVNRVLSDGSVPYFHFFLFEVTLFLLILFYFFFENHIEAERPQ